MSHDTTKKKPIDPEIERPDTVHPDEVIHVPKGSNKARFLMTFLLVVMVLTTFTVGPEVIEVLGGRDRGSKDYMTWKSPSGVVQHVSHKQFLETKRGLAYVLPMVFRSAQRDPNDEQTAAFVALDKSAEESGIVITDKEVRENITRQFPSSDIYRNFLAGYRVSAKEFESNIRRAMRVNRYLDFLAAGLAIPDYKAAETAWKGRHQEFRYDYVELAVASVLDEARALAPKGDDLKLWFDALPEVEKAAYKSKPRVSAEVVGLSLEGTVLADAILAKYPRPEGSDPEALARQYHTDFGYARFPKAPTPEDRTFSQPFDSVKDKAVVEAPIYLGLMDWVADMQKRAAAGEAIDLAAEATALGLAYRKQSDPLSEDMWRDSYKDSFVGRRTVEVVFNQREAPAKLWPAISVDDRAFTYGRVLEVVAESVPAFAEIEARVTTAWADKKAREIAVERLEKLRDSFGTRPDANDPNAPPFQPEADEAKFAEIMKGAGFVVQHRDWQDRNSPPPPDETGGDRFIRTNAALATLRENTVAKAQLSQEGTTAYLVRVGGVRDPDVSKMKVNELNDAVNAQTYQELLMFKLVKSSSKEFLQSRFEVDLYSWHPENAASN